MHDATGSDERARRNDALVERKKACRACPGMVNPACHRGRDYDQSQIGLWTRWQGALDASLMVVGQDWGGVDTLERNAGWEAHQFPTNDALIELLAAAGLTVGQPPQKRHGGVVPQNQVVFLTNAVLCLKAGGARAELPDSVVGRCGKYFLETIRVVRLKVVVTLGKHAFRSVVEGYGDALPPAVRQINRMAAAVLQSDPPEVMPGTRLFPSYHCGTRGRNKRNGRRLDPQKEDWKRLRRWL